MALKGTKTIFHKKMEPQGSIIYYSFRAKRRAIGHAKHSHTPSPQSASRQSPSGLLWEHECSVVASSAAVSHCPLWQWSSYSATRVAIVGNNNNRLNYNKAVIEVVIEQWSRAV